MKLVRIEAPAWASPARCETDGLSPADVEALHHHRPSLLHAIEREVQLYVDDDELCFEDGNFPDRRCLTGAYYLGNEHHERLPGEDTIQLSVCCRFIAKVEGLDREDDYLGLQVWLECKPPQWALYEVFRNTDSSSI